MFWFIKSFNISALMLLLLLLFQLVLKYISVNLETSIGLSISFKKY